MLYQPNQVEHAEATVDSWPPGNEDTHLENMRQAYASWQPENKQQVDGIKEPVDRERYINEVKQLYKVYKPDQVGNAVGVVNSWPPGTEEAHMEKMREKYASRQPANRAWYVNEVRQLYKVYQPDQVENAENIVNSWPPATENAHLERMRQTYASWPTVNHEAKDVVVSFPPEPLQQQRHEQLDEQSQHNALIILEDDPPAQNYATSHNIQTGEYNEVVELLSYAEGRGSEQQKYQHQQQQQPLHLRVDAVHHPHDTNLYRRSTTTDREQCLDLLERLSLLTEPTKAAMNTIDYPVTADEAHGLYLDKTAYDWVKLFIAYFEKLNSSRNKGVIDGDVYLVNNDVPILPVDLLHAPQKYQSQNIDRNYDKNSQLTVNQRVYILQMAQHWRNEGGSYPDLWRSIQRENNVFWQLDDKVDPKISASEGTFASASTTATKQLTHSHVSIHKNSMHLPPPGAFSAEFNQNKNTDDEEQPLKGFYNDVSIIRQNASREKLINNVNMTELDELIASLEDDVRRQEEESKGAVMHDMKRKQRAGTNRLYTSRVRDMTPEERKERTDQLLLKLNGMKSGRQHSTTQREKSEEDKTDRSDMAVDVQEEIMPLGENAFGVGSNPQRMEPLKPATYNGFPAYYSSGSVASGFVTVPQYKVVGGERHDEIHDAHLVRSADLDPLQIAEGNPLVIEHSSNSSNEGIGADEQQLLDTKLDNLGSPNPRSHSAMVPFADIYTHHGIVPSPIVPESVPGKQRDYHLRYNYLEQNQLDFSPFANTYNTNSNNLRTAKPSANVFARL